MGVTSFIESLALEKLNEECRQGTFQIGLIIGQKYEDKAYIIHLAPIPSVSSIEEGGISLDESRDQIQSLSDNARPISIVTVSETAIASHGRQVVRMLPGGLDVLGIYICVPLLELNNSASQGKIRVILTSLHKSTSKYYLGTNESDLEKVVLHGCNQSFKTGVKSIDLSEHGTSLVSGTLKTQATKWIELDYNYSLSYPIYLQLEKSSQSLYKNVLAAFLPWVQTIENSLILIDDKLFKEEDALDPEQDEKPIKKKGTGGRSLIELKPPKVMKAMFLEVCNAVEPVSEIKESSGSVLFSGTLAGRAFLNGKASAKEAFDALRKDLIRSLVARWEMHCDSLVEEPCGTTNLPVLHEPPRRVFLEGGGLPVSLCDYLFPGDSVSDACQSAKELLDIIVSSDNVDDTLEIWADTSSLLTNVPDERSPCSINGNYEHLSQSGRRANNCHLTLAAIVGILAVALAYFFITSTSQGL